MVETGSTAEQVALVTEELTVIELITEVVARAPCRKFVVVDDAVFEEAMSGSGGHQSVLGTVADVDLIHVYRVTVTHLNAAVVLSVEIAVADEHLPAVLEAEQLLWSHIGWRFLASSREVEARDRDVATVAELDQLSVFVRLRRVDRAAVAFECHVFDILDGQALRGLARVEHLVEIDRVGTLNVDVTMTCDGLDEL